MPWAQSGDEMQGAAEKKIGLKKLDGETTSNERSKSKGRKGL
jgi:hypothetical protein